MTDHVEILRAAAAKLRRLTEKTTPGGWYIGQELRIEPGGRALTVFSPEARQRIAFVPEFSKSEKPRENHWNDARWIAVMGPDKAEILAQWLVSETIALRHRLSSTGQEELIPRTPEETAELVEEEFEISLAFARSILEDK